MFDGINNIFYRYDYNRDYHLTLLDLQQNNVPPAQFQQDVNKLPRREQNYLYSFIIDDTLRKSLNIQDAKSLYKTNDQEQEEIRLRWPNSAEKIIAAALTFSLRPAVVAALFEAELLFEPELDKKLSQETIREKVSLFKNEYLPKNKNNYLWALAEYQLSLERRKSGGVLGEWKINFRNYGANIRLTEADGLDAYADDLTERQRMAGVVSAAYVREDSQTYNFIQKFVNSFRRYIQSPNRFSFFPEWLVAKLKSSELSNFFISKVNPWYCAGLFNSAPEPSAVRPLEGTYFQIYKKLAYLGLADTGMHNFTNANLVEILKYSGYIDLGLTNLFGLRAYRYDGDLRHIFSEENAQKLLNILNSYIEYIETTQNVISIISMLNTMFFRREYESDFFNILKDASRQLKMKPQDLLGIYYLDRKLTDWKIPETITRTNYLYALVVIVQENLHQKDTRFENCRVVISPQFREYLNNRYKLSIDNYNKGTQEKFIKEFFQRIEAGANGQKINYDDFVDGFFREINYKKLNNFLNDFMLDAPSFGRPDYYVTSGYCNRLDPIEKILTFHNGVDLQGNIGDPIYTVSGGEVIFAGYREKYGNIVIIRQADNTEIYYAHCDNIIKNRGERVLAGDQIATIGQSGRATGPHVHIEYRRNGMPVPPLNFEQSVWEALATFYNNNRQRYQR